MPDVNTGISPQKEMARGVVTLYKEYLGRGPTMAHTTITKTHVSTVCEDGLTKAERHLAENGDAEIVRSIRRKFQEAMRDDIIALAERVTGRKGRALLSDHDVDTDIAIETVIFERQDEPSSLRAEGAL